MDDKRGEFFMTYVMSDIHGDYSSFYNMLVKINFSPNSLRNFEGIINLPLSSIE